ncbi:phosphoenolpyruvate--protein phosphotransferase [Marinihelvus fidelis]|nr:phosphoenolpyruvate--protein phosphotransferase [Marinihelvus fidelis]
MSPIMNVITFKSPLSGWCAGLDDNPDPVFSGGTLGQGVSIDPTGGRVVAPFDGQVVAVPDSRHAVSLRADNGVECLVHVGIDTVSLAGRGFEALVVAGDRVTTGQVLLTFDPDLLARSAPSLRTPVLVLNAPGVGLRAVRDPGPVSEGDALFEVVMGEDAVIDPAVSQANGSAVEPDEVLELRTGLEHGIHARPAGLLGGTLDAMDARVRLVSAAGRGADVTSPVALMGLGIRRGDVVRIEASGADAAAAIEAVAAFLEPLDASSDESHSQADFELTPEPELHAPEPGSRLPALVASAGLATGVAAVLDFGGEPALAGPEGTPEQERAALDTAIAALAEHLQRQSTTAEGEAAEVAGAHHALVRDPGLLADARSAIEAGHSAAEAWWQATQDAAARLAALDDARLRERVDDLRDIGLQAVDILAGKAPGAALSLPEGAVVLADNLLPSQLMAIEPAAPVAICLAEGGVTSHVALLASARGLPMLVGAGPRLLAIADGTPLCVDAENGEILVAPPEDALAAFAGHVRSEQRVARDALAQAHLPGMTADGVAVAVQANLAGVGEAAAAVEAGAEGCGLLRTEFLFMSRGTAPSVEQQRHELQAIVDALGDRPLVVRTLDAGADKPIDYLDQAAEDNPALGERGIRLQLARPALLDAQLEALLRVESPQPLRVMLPMVTGADEVAAVRERVVALRERLGLAAELRLGIMVETPAAAVTAQRLARHVDFFSIGTNDLAQYTLCMDRLSPGLAKQLDALHPAVLAMVAMTAQAGRDAGIEVSVCGAAAADLQAVPVLVGLGVRKLSVPQARVARVKAALRGVSIPDCEQLATAALACESAAAVRGQVRAWQASTGGNR